MGMSSEKSRRRPTEHRDQQSTTTVAPEPSTSGQTPKRPPAHTPKSWAESVKLATLCKLISVVRRRLADIVLAENLTSGANDGELSLAGKPPFDKRQEFVDDLYAREDLDDEAFVKDLALVTGIPEDSECFARDALATRRLRSHLDALVGELVQEQAKLRREGKSILQHPFLATLAELAFMADPAYWIACTECSKSPAGSFRRVNCKTCSGSGYELR